MRVLLQGEQGLGKRTALIRFLYPILKGRGCLVLHGEPDSMGTPFYPISMAFASIVQERQHRKARRKLWTSAGSSLSRLVPILGSFAPGVLDAFKDWMDREPKPISDQREIAFNLAHIIEELAKSETCFLSLSCIDQFDFSSLTVVSELFHLLPADCSMILTYDPTRAAGRTELDRERLQALTVELSTKHGFTAIRLEPWSISEVAEYTAMAFPELDLAGEEVARLHSLSGGNPLYLDHLTKQLAMISAQTDDTLNNGSDLVGVMNTRIPASLAELVDVRVSYLPKILRQVLEVASVLGIEFPPEPVSAATSSDYLTTLRRLKNLEEVYQLVTEARHFHRFTHEVVRNHVYSRLGPALTQHHHLLIARYLESNPLEGDNDFALAYHFRRAELPEKALHYLQKAADHSRAMFAYATAADRFAEAADLAQTFHPQASELRYELLLKVGTARLEAGQFEESISVLGELDSPETPDHVSVAASLKRASALYMVDDTEVALESLLSALKKKHCLLSDGELTDARLALSSMYYTAGDWQQAQRQFRKCFSMKAVREDPCLRAKVIKRINMFFIPDLALGRLKESLRELTNCDPALAWEIDFNIGANYLLQGRIEKAEKRFTRCLGAFREEPSYRVGYVLNNLGVCSLCLGHLARSSDSLREALKSHTGEFERIASANNLAIVEALRQRPDRAVSLLRPISDELSWKDPILRETVNFNLGWALLLSGDDSQATAQLLVESMPRRESPWSAFKKARRIRLLQRHPSGAAFLKGLSEDDAALLSALQTTGRTDAWSFAQQDYEFLELWMWE